MKATLNTGRAPRFGEPICILGRLERRSRVGDWRTKEWVRQGTPTVDGIIIGERMLSNGTLNGEYGYIAKEHFTAWLVVTGMRSKPFYVLPQDVRV